MMVAEVMLGSTVYSVIGLRSAQVFGRVACFRHSCLLDGLQAMIDSVACWAKKVELSINVAKTKWMVVGNSSNGNEQLMMNGEQDEPVEE